MKYKYSLNDKNQLLIKPPKHKAMPVHGEFSVDKNNQLIYRLNERAAWRKQHNLPSKVSFTGNWKLNTNYDLELKLDETKSQYKGDSLILKGEIISCDRDTLAFEMIGKNTQGLIHVSLLELTGSWQADEFNRIIFSIKKKTSPDVIALESSWQINKNQEIIYIYEKTSLKRKNKVTRILTFEGFWQINSRHRLTYILSHSGKSRFDFRVQVESPNLYPKEGSIKYRIGIGIKRSGLSRTRIICLYGSWRFSRKAGIVFQMDYGRGRFQEIKFGANLNLNKRDEVVFFLTNENKEPLGLNITFTHRLLEETDAQAFLRLKRYLDRKEGAIEAGVRIPF